MPVERSYTCDRCGAKGHGHAPLSLTDWHADEDIELALCEPCVDALFDWVYAGVNKPERTSRFSRKKNQ